MCISLQNDAGDDPPRLPYYIMKRRKGQRPARIFLYTAAKNPDMAGLYMKIADMVGRIYKNIL